ncbi:MAG: TraR/DksA C4-type zinc finger protein [Pseudomonadota bacterium]
MSGESDTAKARRSLQERRQELVDLAHAASDVSGPVELDQTTQGRLSRMDAMQVQAMAQETERRRRLEIVRIDAALTRLDEDAYGYCVACGELIEPKRLAHDPSVPNCLSCASQS